MAGEMSCTSLLESAAHEETAEFESLEISWPQLVQGIRVYARAQPRNFALELLQSAAFAGSIFEPDCKSGSR